MLPETNGQSVSDGLAHEDKKSDSVSERERAVSDSNRKESMGVCSATRQSTNILPFSAPLNGSICRRASEMKTQGTKRASEELSRTDEHNFEGFPRHKHNTDDVLSLTLCT